MRLFVLIVTVCVLVAIPFVIWGDWFDAFLAGDRAVEWLRSFGAMAWVVAIFLLLLDIILPIPATGVMAALGIIYGSVLGGIIGAAGSILSGLIGYVLSRRYGINAAKWIAGEKDLDRCEFFFEKRGGFAVVLSRWLPVMPEAVSCLAGLAKMRFRVFITALVCGTIPMAFVFSYLGDNNSSNPLLALFVSILIPVILWIPVRYLIFNHSSKSHF